MKPLYTTTDSRRIDQSLIEGLPAGAYPLMCRAAQACFRSLLRYFPKTHRIVLYAGGGNNGGDGYVVARYLLESGRQPQVVALTDPAKLPEPAATACADYMRAGGKLITHKDACKQTFDVIVDGILGSGLSRPLSDEMCMLITEINDCAARRVAIDVPTGLNADTGCAMPVAIRADLTVTFIARKQGLYTADARDYCGELVFDDLQTAPKTQSYRPSAYLAGYSDCKQYLAPRRANVHKGVFGHVLVIGGGEGMMGAVCLAGLAALRAGAGLVTVATHPSHAAQVSASYPVLMTKGISCESDLDSLMEQVDVIVLGPGTVDDVWGNSLFDRIAQCDLPAVVDAGALRILARKPKEYPHWVITPHPGEAAVLLGTDTSQVQNDRFAALDALHERYAASVVLKGTGSLIKTPAQKPVVCSGGNAGMATAGMGDILSGVIGSFLAQKLSVTDAVIAGVCVHAEAGDRTAQHGARGMVASDILDAIRYCVNV